MGLKYPAPLFVNILFPLLAVGLLLITYYLFGSQVLSSNLFIIGVYTLLVPLLFFSYGKYTEKRVAKKELNRFIKNNLELFKFLNPGISDSVNKNANIGDNPIDEETKKTNSELIKYSLIASSIIMVLFVGLSYILWFNVKNKKFNIMMAQNSLILLLVVIVEIIFTTLIAGNYRQLDDNRIKKELFKQLYDYSQVCTP